MTQAKLHELWLEYKVAKQCSSVIGALEDDAIEEDLRYRDKEYTPRTHPKEIDIIPIGRAKWVEAVDIPDWFVKEVSYAQQYNNIILDPEPDPPPTLTEEIDALLKEINITEAQQLKNDLRYQFWAAGRRRPKKTKPIVK